MTTATETQIFSLDLEKFVIDPERFQARDNVVDDRHVRKLAETWDIRKCSPLLVWPNGRPGHFYLLSGHHRYHAARAMGLDKLPVQVIDGNEQDAIEIAVTDNFGRLEYGPVEMSRIVKRYRDAAHNWESIRDMTGYSIQKCQEYFYLGFASGLIRERVAAGTLDYRFGSAIGKAGYDYELPEERQNEFLESCINKRDYSITQLREALKRFAPVMVQDDLFGLEFGLDNERAERREIEKKLRETRRGISAMENLERYGARVTGEMKRAVASLQESARRYEHELYRFDCKMYGDPDPGPYRRNNRRA